MLTIWFVRLLCGLIVPMFKNRKRSSAKKPRHRKTGGIYFLTLIPLSLLIGLAAAINLVLVYTLLTEDLTRLALFASGFIAASTIVSTMKLHKFRTFVHELKHAIVVIFTGNKVREFHVEKHTGHVSYELLMSKAHFAPLIICLLYTSPSPRDATLSRMPSSA